MDEQKEIKVALVGNPNVGKSTIFNSITGMHQHTGNWPGKTVSIAVGKKIYNDKNYSFVDLPGTYSLFPNSQEEEIASEYLCSGESDITVIVCDATCLERNLILALQAIEVSKKTIVCLNMLDEAKKKNINIDIQKLSEILNVPVIGITARKKKTIINLLNEIEKTLSVKQSHLKIEYNDAVMQAIDEIEEALSIENITKKRIISLNLLENEERTRQLFSETSDMREYKAIFDRYGYDDKIVRKKISTSFVEHAEQIASKVVNSKNKKSRRIEKIDRIITGKYTAFPIMALLLILIFWITIVGANYPSEILSDLFKKAELLLLKFFQNISLPNIVTDIIINGVYRVLSWVVSVMLPPMAIFFPLFTLLEDLGYLPRIAFNLDSCFQKFNACGKQSLTYCMSFGCNAAGIVGTRIIDSEKEKLIAVATNNFIPCNGRFPILICIISIFFVSSFSDKQDTFLCALILALFIILSIIVAMFMSKLLSKTLLKDEKTSYTLELPPYRKPQVGKIIVRSIFDRTLFVLGRALAVAAPAGLLIWILANVRINDITMLKYACDFLEPVGKIFGMDGVLILAFILGLPANEIVIPIAVMCYQSNSHLTQVENLQILRNIFLQNGWTSITAICVIIFTIMHWPCSTSIITVYKETKSIKWTILSTLTPTICGLIICFIINIVGHLLQINL